MDKLDNVRSAVVSTASKNAKVVTPGVSAPVDNSSGSKLSSDQITQSSSSTSNRSVKRLKTLAEDVKVREEKVREAVKEINNELFKLQSELGFSVDKVANDVVVTVKRKETGEIVRQIPSESALKIAHNFEKLKGILLDESF